MTRCDGAIMLLWSWLDGFRFLRFGAHTRTHIHACIQTRCARLPKRKSAHTHTQVRSARSSHETSSVCARRVVIGSRISEDVCVLLVLQAQAQSESVITTGVPVCARRLRSPIIGRFGVVWLLLAQPVYNERRAEMRADLSAARMCDGLLFQVRVRASIEHMRAQIRVHRTRVLTLNICERKQWQQHAGRVCVYVNSLSRFPIRTHTRARTKAPVRHTGVHLDAVCVRAKACKHRTAHTVGRPRIRTHTHIMGERAHDRVRHGCARRECHSASA